MIDQTAAGRPGRVVSFDNDRVGIIPEYRLADHRARARCGDGNAFIKTAELAAFHHQMGVGTDAVNTQVESPRHVADHQIAQGHIDVTG